MRERGRIRAIAFERLCEKRREFTTAYERFLGRFSLDEIGLDAGDLSATGDTTTGRRVAL
jgi:hypothetical protein